MTEEPDKTGQEKWKQWPDATVGLFVVLGTKPWGATDVPQRGETKSHMRMEITSYLQSRLPG
jgi:hypothetical protein